MNRSKDRYMVPHCSSYREYSEDIPIGGVIHLPMILGGYIYQMHTQKRDLYLKKENISIIPGGAMVIEGVYSMYLHHFDIPCSKGEILFSGKKIGGSVLAQGKTQGSTLQ
jgi:hypothetical protein